MVCRRWNAVLKLTSSVLAFRCRVGPKSSSREVCNFHHVSPQVVQGQFPEAGRLCSAGVEIGAKPVQQTSAVALGVLMDDSTLLARHLDIHLHDKTT